MSLTTERLAFKPFGYPWAYDFWKKQQQVHWMPEEVPMADDIKDWISLEEGERELLTQIFRFFTQGDVEVNNCYHRIYLSIFKPTEVVMMLTSFANMETIHIAAYSLLMDTIGMPEGEYTRFMEYKAMRDKFEFGRSFEVTDPRSVALAMAVFGAFTEGLQLFASFAMLMNFPRFNKMKGMGQIVTWSIRDESLHCEGILRLYHAYCQENGLVGDPELERQITEALHVIVSHEDAFIDQAFAGGPVKGMNAADLKAYIRWIANMRLRQLHMPEAFVVKKNPLPWLEAQLNGVEHANFFEARSTEYSKAAITGSFDDASFDDAFA